MFKSFGNKIFKKLPNYFQNDCIMLHFYQQYMCVSVYLFFTNLTGVVLHLMVVFLCISLMTDNVEHVFHGLFINLLASGIYSLPIFIDLFLLLSDSR